MQEYLKEEELEYTDQDIGEYLISVITGGQYVEPHTILREYIQNSHDAIVAWKSGAEEGRIDIKIDKRNIHVIDNGPGMTRDELVASMSKVGISSKPLGGASGFMGIGKFAGLSMAEKVRIDSSKYGVPGKNRVTFNASDMIQAIERRRRTGESRSIVETLKEHGKLNRDVMPEAAEAHYTAVHLLGISDDYLIPISKRDEFLKRLSLVAPIKQDPAFSHAAEIERLLETIAPDHYAPLELYVDGRPLYRPWCDNLLTPTKLEVLDEDGNQMAYGWACQNDDSAQIADPLLRGIALLQRGIAVGERGLAEELGMYGTTSNYIYFRWHVGELYITDPTVLLTANRMSLRYDDRVVMFKRRVEQELQKLSNAAALYSRRDNAAKKAPEHIRYILDIEARLAKGSISLEMVPSVVKRLAGGREDLKRRRPDLLGEKKKEANRAILVADELIKQLTALPVTASPTEDAERPEQTTSPTQADLGGDDITVLEEEARQISTIPDQLGFSPRETLIFESITQAVAEMCGGQETDRFAAYLQKIEDALRATFN